MLFVGDLLLLDVLEQVVAQRRHLCSQLLLELDQVAGVELFGIGGDVGVLGVLGDAAIGTSVFVVRVLFAADTLGVELLLAESAANANEDVAFDGHDCVGGCSTLGIKVTAAVNLVAADSGGVLYDIVLEGFVQFLLSRVSSVLEQSLGVVVVDFRFGTCHFRVSAEH